MLWRDRVVLCSPPSLHFIIFISNFYNLSGVFCFIFLVPCARRDKIADTFALATNPPRRAVVL